MAERKIRWGILSTANIGLKKVTPAIMKSPLSEVVAVASRDVAKAEQYIAELGLTGKAKAHGSYEALFADPDVDAIYNPLPNHLHVPWTAAAARAGKHVLCEKPIALTATEAQTLVQVQRETGKIISEAFMVRSHPQWHEAKAWVDSGRLGELVSIQCAFTYFNRDAGNIRNKKELGGGALYDIGCYAVNTSRYLVGREPKRVIALCERDPEFGTDRLTSGMLDYGGVHLTFTCSTQAVPYQRVQVFGTKGRLDIEIPFNAPPDQPCKVFLDDGSTLNTSSAKAHSFPVVDQYGLQSEDFSRAIRTGGSVENSIEVAVGNMRVIDALFRSAESRGWEAP